MKSFLGKYGLNAIKSADANICPDVVSRNGVSKAGEH